MKQLAPGILELSNGLHYFSAATIYHVLRDYGFDEDNAARIVGKLIKKALDTSTVHSVNA